MISEVGSASVIFEIRLISIECLGACDGLNIISNDYCSLNIDVEWKALDANCRYYESSRGWRTMDQAINYCADGNGYDLSITCYK